MAQYINKKDQEDILALIEDFMKESNDGQNLTIKANLIMTKLYTYFDKIIKGVIYSPLYRYHLYADYEDLMSEGRIALYKSIIKKQWKENLIKIDDEGVETSVKGASFFSFCTTVVAKNLYSYTIKLNRHNKFKADQELDIELMDRTDFYEDDIDSKLLITEVFNELRLNFEGKQSFVELTDLLELYFNNNIGKKKFFKKHFTEFCKSKCYSPSLVNSYLNYLKNVKTAKNLFFYKDLQ